MVVLDRRWLDSGGWSIVDADGCGQPGIDFGWKTEVEADRGSG